MGEPGNKDTLLGGVGRVFPETSWALLTRLRNSERGAFLEGFDDLCRTYWKPVYVYVRLGWSKSNEEAKDLTQDFFVWLLEDESIRDYEPERGGFRPYLKTLLRRFLSHQEEARRRIKRGGNAKVFSLQSSDLESAQLPADPRAVDPEKAFEEAWARQILDQAFERVRARRKSAGDDLSLRVYDAYELSGAERPSYKEVGERFGLKDTDVRAHLFSLREELRAEVRAEIARLTADDAELEDEWRSLFGR